MMLSIFLCVFWSLVYFVLENVYVVCQHFSGAVCFSLVEWLEFLVDYGY